MRKRSTPFETTPVSKRFLPTATLGALLLGGCPDNSADVVVRTEPCANTFPVHEDHDHGGGGHGHGSKPMPREMGLPRLLSLTGLYTDISTKTVHPAYDIYTPRYQLWSDGADKRRYVYIPECQPIDNSDPDNWQVPVGTRFFKEFSVNGKRVETRIMQRLGTGPRDWAFASYRWTEDEGEAIIVPPDGLENANGTAHDIPSRVACTQCHGGYAYGGGRPSRGLGFSAIQLSHDGDDLTVAKLAAAGRFRESPVLPYTVPGDAVTQHALGYLHANCGNCHNESVDGVPQVDLNLWLDRDQTTVEETGAYLTAVERYNTLFNDQHVTARVASGDPDSSSLYYRMNQRNNNAQMPPIATEVVDQEGLDLVRAWIESLP